MNTNRKLFTGCIIGILLLCLATVGIGFFAVTSAGWILARLINSNPTTVAEVGQSISNYTLPDGFTNGFSTRLLGLSAVGYNGTDGHSHIYLLQMPSYINIDQTEMERQLSQATGNTDKYTKVTVVGEEQANLRGQETTLTVSEGINHDNQPYREVSGLFPGKGGQALVVVSMPTGSWNQDLVDNFLASIK